MGEASGSAHIYLHLLHKSVRTFKPGQDHQNDLKKRTVISLHASELSIYTGVLGIELSLDGNSPNPNAKADREVCGSAEECIG